MKHLTLIIITLLLFAACKEKPDHTSKACDQYGCVTCKTYCNYDDTKCETKCIGSGEYAAMYADDVNGDPDGIVVEETSEGL
jgi:hypothetical protein